MSSRSCSLFSSAPSTQQDVDKLRERMRIMGCREQILEEEHEYFRQDSRLSRPLLRVVCNSETCKIVQMSPPDTNAVRRSTSESILAVECISKKADLDSFLSNCRYKPVGTLKQSGFEWNILECILRAVSFDNSDKYLIHLYSYSEPGAISSTEDRLLRVCSHLSDIVMLIHPDNSIIKQ
jgi:hypothetical protein